MKIYKHIEQRSNAWEEIRKGKITGSKLKNIVTKRGLNKKVGFYDLIAEKICQPYDVENAIERGVELEESAKATFENMLGKKIEDIGFCTHDNFPEIALSPDGFIQIDGKYKEAVEIKCLSPARHLQAYFEEKIPSEFEEQAYQYFVVNEDLETLFFIFYNPDMAVLPIHWVLIKRKDVEEQVKALFGYQVKVLQEVNKLVANLLFK